MKQKHVFLTTNKRTLTTPSSLWLATPPLEGNCYKRALQTKIQSFDDFR